MQNKRVGMDRIRGWRGTGLRAALAIGTLLASLGIQAGPIQDLAPGAWYEIPNSHLSSVVPNPAPAGDPANIMNAWSGATYDTDREQLIVWGGGHSDYSGNEVYSFGPMTSATPTWQRLTDPSPAQTGQTPTYDDGKPRSNHTYDLLVYHQGLKKMISFGLGSIWSTGGEILQIFGFDPGTKQWDPVSTYPLAKSDVQGTSAVYDPSTGLIWHRGQMDEVLESFNATTGAQATYHDGFGYVDIYYKAAIDPVHKIMIGVGGYNGGGPLGAQKVGVVVWDLTNPSNSFIAHTSGDNALENGSGIGLEFHPPSGTFIGWSGGGVVYRLTEPADLRNGTWIWQSISPAAGATPTAANPGGTYGRFRYVPSQDVFVAVNSSAGDVFVYRLPGSSAPSAPAIALSASPAQVNSQGSSTLTWSTTNASSCTASGGWSGSVATSGTQTVGPISANTTYTLTCTNSSGTSSSKSATVSIVTATPAPTVSISASPTSVASGGASTLSWTSLNATSCTASGAWSGTKATQGSQSIASLTTTGVFTLTCTGTGGSGQSSSQVTVTGTPTPAAPTLNLSATPTTVQSGGSTQLSWSSSNATSCTASGAWTGTKAVTGSEAVGSLTANATFTLQCSGTGGSISKSAGVTISATAPPTASAPTVTINATPSTVTMNGTSMITWSSTNASSCTASGGWSGSVALSGSEQTAALQTGTTFTLACTGSGGSKSMSTQVAVTAPVSSPPMTPTPTSSSSGGGGSLEWVTLGLLAALVLGGCINSRMEGPRIESPVTARTSPAEKAAPVAAVVLAIGSVAAAHAAGTTTVTISTASSTPLTNIPITFGQVFKPGDIPASAVLSATTASGTTIPLQVDKKATHGDGSLRHAVLTAQLPSLASGSAQAITLSTGGSAPSGSAMTLANLLATPFDAQVQLNVGGTTYTASARTLLQSGSVQQWLNGPLVSEWIVGGSVKDGSGNAHPHLAAYFHVRAFAGQPINRVRVDVVVENGWTMVAGPQNFTYSANVLVGGSSVYSATITHYHHARWHKRFWWGGDPQAYVKPDTTYLRATGAVPNFANLTPSDTFLNSLRQTADPMSNGDLSAYFANTGGAVPIGPLPIWGSTFAVSADQRAFNNMLADDDAAGSYAAHYRDETTGRPVSIADHPMLTTRFSQAEVGLNSVPDATGATPLTPDDAHQPSIAFLSYLTTGDYYYLEELHFWVSWNHLQANPLPPDGYRQGVKGIMLGQIRGQAWEMRNLGQAAYATPDNHPYKAVLVNSVTANLQYMEQQYPNSPTVNKLGALQSYDGYTLFAPWMDHFYTFSMGYLVDLGFPAQTMRNFKAKFPVGLMGTTDYCYLHATTYHLTVGTSNIVWWPDFATLYIQNFGGPPTSCPAGGAMDGYPDQPDGYVANLQPALAAAVDAGVPGAQAAWNRMTTSSPRPDFSNYPNWAVVPRAAAVGGGTPVTVSLIANPASVASGASTTLTWSSTGATACTASGAWTGTKATSGSQSSGALTAATTYTISCTGNSQTVQQSVTVAIGTTAPPPSSAPTVILTANPTSVASGATTTLTWSSTNATSCTASNGWTGTMATSGSKASATLTAATTFALSCTGTGGSASASAMVTIAGSTPTPPPPTPTMPGVTISLSPATVTSGGSTTITWSSTNATGCTASNGWTGSKAISGNATISNLSATTTYGLMCTGSGGSTPTVSATVAVTAAATGPGSGGSGSPGSSSSGGGGTMTWPSLVALLTSLLMSMRGRELLREKAGRR